MTNKKNENGKQDLNKKNDRTRLDAKNAMKWELGLKDEGGGQRYFRWKKRMELEFGNVRIGSISGKICRDLKRWREGEDFFSIFLNVCLNFFNFY